MELSRHLTLDDAAIMAPNLADRFDTDDLKKIGRFVVEGYKVDEKSREVWLKRNEAALNLALQLQEAKTFPWPGAANVKFPLVTIAAIQWHSRAYPILVQGPDVVKAATNGPDPQGKLHDAANRVSKYMSYQLLEDSPSWEEETDRALLQVPIVGCAFKKTYYSGTEGRNVSELVSAKNFVINYFARSIETAQRKTHIIPFYRNDVYERVKSGVWLDVLDENWYLGQPPNMPSNQTTRQDRRTGQNRPMSADNTTPFQFLEQHVRVDLDGDGYAEPYVIVVQLESEWVCRITANFTPDSIKWTSGRKRAIERIQEDQYFTKYPFIPSPDGGFYDIGFGSLLGPINESVDSIINQLLDAGTLATTSGGFLGRGVKIRGGEYSFRPFGWQRVDSTGEDLAKGVYPFPVREPSRTLFELLSLLVDYTNRMAGTTEIMVGGNPGQNTPAETSRLMAEQGAKINSAIFKRVWRGFKQEFQKLYRLNKLHTPTTVLTYGQESGWITRDDFNLPEEAIRPAADPNLTSDTMRVQQAMLIKEQSMTTAGYNRDLVELNVLRALKVENIPAIFPGSKATGPIPNPRVLVEQIKAQGKQASDKARLQEKIMALMADREKTKAEIENLQAQTAQIIASVGEAQASTQLQAFEAHLSALKAMDESQRGYLELLMKGMQDGTGPGTGGGAQPMAPQPGNPGGQAGPPPTSGGVA